MSGPLQGVKVFDLTVEGVGTWATMILATMGANVIKIDSPHREVGYRLGDATSYKGLSTVYMHCHLGKRGMYLDLKTSHGQDVAHRLLKDADIFVENMKLGTVARLGLSYEDVSKINPRIVYDNCPGWGDSGPFKDRGSGDTVTQAFSGPAGITGKRGGDPESMRFYALHDFNGSSYIVVTVLLGLLYRERTGSGIKMQNIQQMSTIAIQTSRLAEFLATEKDIPRMGSGCTTTVPHKAFLCGDNKWLAVGVIDDDQWHRLCKVLKSYPELKDSRFDTNTGRVNFRDEVEAKLSNIFSTRSSYWWVIQLRKHKIPVSLFYDYTSIPDLPQVKANSYITSVNYPGIGMVPFANLPFQYSDTPITIRPGIWPGQDTEQIENEGFGEDNPDGTVGYFGPDGACESGVLDGVTVIDMTQGLCGPYASLLLADAGAKVIKIEPVGGDYARNFGPPMIGNVSAVFFHLNRNKEGISLDLSGGEDRIKLIELIKKSNIFIEDEGQSNLRRLGLSYDQIRKINPNLIYCSITPYGTKGPLKDQPSSELVLQAMSDFPNNLGLPGEEPIRMGPDMASLGTGVYITQAILGGLYYQWRMGSGQHITVSMLGTLLHQKGVTWESMAGPDDWSGFYCDGNLKHPDYGYRALDQRIVMADLKDDSEIPNILKKLGLDRYAGNQIFKLPSRDIFGWHGKGNYSLDALSIFEESFKKWKADELVQLLIDCGLSASVVNTYSQLFRHSQMDAFNILGSFDNSDIPGLRSLGPPWRLYGVSSVVHKPYVGL